MKTMTCRQLSGACDVTFQAETFEEMGELSKKHAMQMMHDPAHKEAMHNMMERMKDPLEMKKCMDDMQKAFDEAPESNSEERE